MTKERMATLAFVGFALLIAFRDVATDRWLEKEGAHWLTFIVCASILALSVINILFSGKFEILKKLKTPGAAWRAIMLGSLSGIIYLGIFFLIGTLGAALYGFIDYGFIPLATVLVGWLMFGKKLSIDFFGSFAIFTVGLALIMATRTPEPHKPVHFSYVALALFLPLIAALSDGFTKWLLNEENAGLTRPELLVVRFLPATVLTYIYSVSQTGTMAPQIIDWPTVLSVAVIGGWAPLMLLCTGLGKAKAEMDKLAVWEFMIPVIILIGTYDRHWGLIKFYPLLGAALILSAMLIAELNLISRWKTGSGDDADSSETGPTSGKDGNPKEAVTM